MTIAIMNSISKLLPCWISLTALLWVVTTNGQDVTDGRGSNEKPQPLGSSPIATCEAGNYVLEVWHVDDAVPERSAHDIAIHLDLAGNMGEPNTFKERQRGPRGGGEIGGTAVGGGGGSGGGGMFRSPKKVLGIRVLEKSNRKIVREAVFGAGYEVIEEDGSKSESTLPESFRTRYVWPKTKSESTSNNQPKVEDLTPLPFYLKTPTAQTIKSLKGVLVVPDEEVAQVVFSPADIQKKARKSAGKLAVQVESIEKKENQFELVMLLFSPPPPPRNPGDFQAFIKQSRLASSTRLLVHLEDTEGGIYFGTPQSRSGNTFSSSGGGGSISSGTIKPKRVTNQSTNTSLPQKFPFSLKPVSGGANTKQLVCEVRRPKSAPKVIEFEFGIINLKAE